jgi:prevent-host-death family protein
MNEIGIRDLRKDLSSHVKRVAAGETIIVTVDGEPRAKLVPVEPGSNPRTIEELIAAGRVLPARREGQPPRPAPPRIKGLRPTREVLDEVRSERF